MFELAEIFNSRLPALITDFKSRPVQLAYAEAINGLIEAGGNGIVEAGTGIGKTLGYLVPAMLSGKTTLVSTGTRNLQDQLFLKDLPVLKQMFPDVRTALLKGRSNYLCLHRLNRNISVAETTDDIDSLVEVRQWSQLTRSGDLSEFLDPEENPGLMNRITSTRDNCLGGRCPEFDRCPLYKARERAAGADLVVVNHHLLFADVSRKEDALQSLLPDAGLIVVDEAHRLPDVARQFFGDQVSSGQIAALVRDTKTELKLLGNDDPATLGCAIQLEEQLDRLRHVVLETDEQDFRRWLKTDAANAVEQTDYALQELGTHLDRVAERSDGLAHLRSRAFRFLDHFAFLTEAMEDNETHVHWINRKDNGFTFHLSPISISDDMQPVINAGASWIFTSATLRIDGDFRHMRSELGLAESLSERFESPFDYPGKVKGVLPVGLPDPGDDEHTISLVDKVRPYLDANPGRTFFLFTSYRALRTAAEQLKNIGKPILMQGSRSRTELVNDFKKQPGAILLATQSFWEGVDVRGADLRCLIIDKLPFPNPTDPLLRAQSSKIMDQGGSSFEDLVLPKMALALKQGFGRLIREESDAGLFILGDNRVHKRTYGLYVLDQLPDIKWLNSDPDAIAWLRTL